MKLGFTGTRHGMTDHQKQLFRQVLSGIQLYEFHHGSCQGADVEAARIVREVVPNCLIVAHPGPDGDKHREVSGVDNVTTEPKSHFARNRDIVNETDLLAAAPLQDEPQNYGGTWYTIGYARKAGRESLIIWPKPKKATGPELT
jgi:hypothetical protein